MHWVQWRTRCRDALDGQYGCNVSGMYWVQVSTAWMHQAHGGTRCNSMAAVPAMAVSKTFVEVAPDAH